MGTLLNDIRHGVRIYVKTPTATILIILALALGIGASTTVFSVVDAILIKPLPYDHPERIVIPWRQAPAKLNLGYKEIPWGLRSFNIIRDQTRLLEFVGAFKADTFNLTGVGEPAFLEGLRASAGFFPTLGVSPLIGRTFTPFEDQIGQEHEVVLGYSIWRQRFGMDPRILGRVIDLNGENYTVIGIMPRDFAFPKGDEMPGSFDFPRHADLWLPLASPAAPRPDAPDDLTVIGRLRPAATVSQFNAEMGTLTQQMENEVPQLKGWFNAQVTPLTQQVTGDTKTPLILILGSVGVVLLIACSNVASLLLARSLQRRREFAIREALGAGKRRLIFQLLTESLLLSFAGGILGIVFAIIGVFLAKIWGPANIPRLQDATLDLRLCVFAVGLTFVVGIGFGVFPAFVSARQNLMGALKEGDLRSVGGLGKVTRNGLIIFEVAMALVLVASAGLLTRTFVSMLRTDPGFDRAQVLTFEVALPPSQYSEVSSQVNLYREMLEGLRVLPSVDSVGLASAIPMAGGTESSIIRIPDHPASNREHPVAGYTVASPGYFSAVGTPLLQGRDFLDSDDLNAVPVAIINQAMAKKFWPGENPVGKQVALGSPRYPTMMIIGIAADVKRLSLRETPGPEMYVPYSQKVYPSLLVMHVVVRADVDPANLSASIRNKIHALNPDLPIANETSFASLVQTSMAQPRFSMFLLTAFSFVSLILACTGIYAVMSYSVQERSQEIGIRMALGAEDRTVFRMILGHGARLAVVGMFLGLALSFVTGKMIANFLYGVRPTDPLTFVAVSMLLVIVILFACYFPARRATRIDPLEALRYK
jgi:predicted permease